MPADRAGAEALSPPADGGPPPPDRAGVPAAELFELDDDLGDAYAACCVVTRLVDHFIAERRLEGDDAEAAVYAVYRLRDHLAAARERYARIHSRAGAAGLLGRGAAPAHDEDETAGTGNG